MEPFTYEKIVSDIMKVSEYDPGNPEGPPLAREYCRVFAEFLIEYAQRTNGYMFVAAFMVAFTEMRNIANAAKGRDKEFIDSLIKTIIGSYGSTIQ